MFYQPTGPLPTLEEYRANVNTHGSRILHPKGYRDLDGTQNKETLDAYYAIVANRLSGKGRSEELLEGVKPRQFPVGSCMIQLGQPLQGTTSEQKT